MSRETSHRCSRERRRVVENVFSRHLALKKKSTWKRATKSSREGTIASKPSNSSKRISFVCEYKRELDICNILTPMLCVCFLFCRCAGISTQCVKQVFCFSTRVFRFFFLFCALFCSLERKTYTQQQHSRKIFKLRVINKNIKK